MASPLPCHAGAAAHVAVAPDVLAGAVSPLALVLAACAVLLLPGGRFAAGRPALPRPPVMWRVSGSGRGGTLRSADGSTDSGRRARLGRSVLAPTAGAALATALLDFPPWFVILATGAVAAARYRALHRVAPPTTAETLVLAAVLDVIAACLDAGLSLSAALSAAVGTAAGPDGPALFTARGIAAGSDQAAARGFPWSRARPVRSASARAQPAPSPALTALTETAALLALGGGEYAWQPIERVSARPGLTPLGSLAAAAQRSASGGLHLADAARETAQDLRAACTATVSARAARAGVAMTAPLTLCFLPAFLCLGLAPVVWGLIQSLHF